MYQTETFSQYVYIFIHPKLQGVDLSNQYKGDEQHLVMHISNICDINIKLKIFYQPS